MSHTKSNKRKRNILIISSLVAAAVALAAVLFISTRLFTFGAATPVFVFDQEKAPGWWAGGSYNSQENFNENEYAGDTPREQLPIASMTVMQGEGEGASAPDSCFIMYAYYNYPLADKATAYEAFESMNGFATDAHYFQPTTTTAERITTPWGDVSYEFRQYATVTDDDYLKGNSIGFATPQDGHIVIKGVCATAEQLAEIVPVLGAVRLQ